MVQNKGRFSYRQYVKDKTTKPPSKCDLGHDVVMRLMKSLARVIIILDNYYTSVHLLVDLLKYPITASAN